VCECASQRATCPAEVRGGTRAPPAQARPGVRDRGAVWWGWRSRPGGQPRHQQNIRRNRRIHRSQVAHKRTRRFWRPAPVGRQLRTERSPFSHGHKRQHHRSCSARLFGDLRACGCGPPGASRRTRSQPAERFCFCLAEFCLLCRPSEVARFRYFNQLLTPLEWLVDAGYYMLPQIHITI
jgi:hypothetical protein